MHELIDRVLERLPEGRFEPRHRIMDFFGYVRLDDLLAASELTSELVRARAALIQESRAFELTRDSSTVPYVLLRDPGQ